MEQPDQQLDERKEAMWVHLKSLISFPLAGFLGGSLILRKRENEVSSYIKKHWDAVFNFQLTLAIYAGALYGLAIVIGSTIHDYFGSSFGTFVTCLIVATFGLCLFWFLMTLRAALRAKRGLEPPYPRLPFAVHQEQWPDWTSPNNSETINKH